MLPKHMEKAYLRGNWHSYQDAYIDESSIGASKIHYIRPKMCKVGAKKQQSNMGKNEAHCQLREVNILSYVI